MKTLNARLFVSIVTLIAVMPLWAGQTNECNRPHVSFRPVDVYIDSGSERLAAYQFELIATAGQVKIVGVEGGEHAAFANPPYYDPAALQHDRIIIAAFNTSKDLPKGKTRVVTLHMQIIGDIESQYEIKLTVAANADGKNIPATITFVKGK